MISLFTLVIHWRRLSQWGPEKMGFTTQFYQRSIQHCLLPSVKQCYYYRSKSHSNIGWADSLDLPLIRKIYFLHRLILFHY